MSEVYGIACRLQLLTVSQDINIIIDINKRKDNLHHGDHRKEVQWAALALAPVKEDHKL